MNEDHITYSTEAAKACDPCRRQHSQQPRKGEEHTMTTGRGWPRVTKAPDANTRGTNLRAPTCCATPQGCSAHRFRSQAALLVPCNTKVNSIHSGCGKSARKASQPREAPAPHVKQRVAAASICSYCDGCRVLTAAFCELDCARQRYTTWPWAVTLRYFNLLNTCTHFPPTYCWCYHYQADHPCYNPRRTWCPLH